MHAIDQSQRIKQQQCVIMKIISHWNIEVVSYIRNIFSYLTIISHSLLKYDSVRFTEKNQLLLHFVLL